MALGIITDAQLAVVGTVAVALIGFAATIIAVLAANRHARIESEAERNHRDRTRFHDLRLQVYRKFTLMVDEWALGAFEKQIRTEKDFRELNEVLMDIGLIGSKDVSKWSRESSMRLHRLLADYAHSEKTGDDAEVVVSLDALLTSTSKLRRAIRDELGVEPIIASRPGPLERLRTKLTEWRGRSRSGKNERGLSAPPG